MRPIDRKLKYQVDKVIRLAATGGAGMYILPIVLMCIVLALICQRPDILINKHAYQWYIFLASWLMFGVSPMQPKFDSWYRSMGWLLDMGVLLQGTPFSLWREKYMPSSY